MAGGRWLIAGLVAVLVGVAGVGAMAAPWWGGGAGTSGAAYGPGGGPGYGYGPGMMWGYGQGYGPGYGPGCASGCTPDYGSGYGPGYGPGMMRGFWWGGAAPGSSGSGGSTGGSRTATAASVTVRMDNLRYDPAQITIKVGTTVAFVNDDDVPHNVVNGTLNGANATPAFASPLIPPGGSWTHTFNTAGTFPILCTVPGHAAAGMVGTVTVTP